ncbi:MAG TPA: thioredoxin domain-containing protein [Actinomycetes bacterium]|nr:thioredoxin domain-containing protein [Actinomycetes bacterium]
MNDKRSQQRGGGGSKVKNKRAARERLAEQRAAQQRADRRRRSSGIAIAVIVGLVVVGIIGYAWWASNNDGPDDAALPALVQESGGGVVIGDGPVDVTLWEDFQCPNCKDFEAENGAMLDRLVTDGDITLTIHPLSFLDSSLGNDSSVQAANAFGCAADAGEEPALAFHQTVYANQPPENPGTPAWSTDDLVGWGQDVGISDDSWESCVNDVTYEGWVTQVQASMTNEGITGTPTAFVNGEKVQLGSETLESAINDALKGNQ